MEWTSTDIAAFLTAMGQTAVIDDGSIQGDSITAIYSAPFATANLFDDGVETHDPYIDCASTDVSTVKRNTAVRVAGKDYLATPVENENTGWTRLILRERFD